jgi:hypothetical protein
MKAFLASLVALVVIAGVAKFGLDEFGARLIDQTSITSSAVRL